MFGDPLIWVLILPGMVLGGLAQSWVKSNLMKFSKVPLRQGLTGAEVARYILDSKGLRDVAIEPSRGVLSDHYDPRGKVLRLSEAVYGVRSIAAAGIAAHVVQGPIVVKLLVPVPGLRRDRILPGVPVRRVSLVLWVNCV